MEGILHISDERQDGQLRDPSFLLRPLNGGVVVPRQMIRDLRLRPGLLVRGNHDSRSISWYMDHGFVFACDALELGGAYFTHKPSPYLPAGCTYNVHGHLHNRFAADYRKYPHCRLFAMEHSKYEPMLLERFLHKGCPGGLVLPDPPREGEELC